MSKYGNGVSMKDVQMMEMQNVRKIMNKYGMSAKDRTVIEDALKEAFFQWCKSNASCCMIENILQELLDNDHYTTFTKLFIAMFPNYENQKLSETFAWFYEERKEE